MANEALVRLVVGLGNPGPRYEANRHNVGFMVAEQLCERWGLSTLQSKFQGHFGWAQVVGQKVAVLLPETFMNLSGESVAAATRFFKIAIEEVLVIHDELDLPFEAVRLKVGGGAAGHNGLRSIIQHCGPDFVRLRVGIGRPRSRSVHDHVLSDFGAEESKTLDDVLDRAAGAVELAVRRGVPTAMNRVNARARAQPNQ